MTLDEALRDYQGKFYSFTGDIYYPSGGAKDLNQIFDTLEEAKEQFSWIDWCHIAIEWKGRLVPILEWEKPNWVEIWKRWKDL